MSPSTTPASPEPAPGTAAPVWTDAQRQHHFDSWLKQVAAPHALKPTSLRLASADASFRRYFRIDTQAGSRIIMDAPPEQENSRPFVQVATLMAQAGVHVPEVLDWNEEHGFMLLSDLGGQTMLQAMDTNARHTSLHLYLQAIEALIAWQCASRSGVLPVYDAPMLRRELELFPTWYLQQHRAVELAADLRVTLDQAFTRIIADNLSWPSVYVHRDFMPRNLMVAAQLDASAVSARAAAFPQTGALPAAPGPVVARLGVLDFQDAVYGPITYDIASLMRDAFVSWDEDFVLDVTVRYWEQARRAGLPVGTDFGAFYRGVEWMGLQRHLKVAGIFARLTLRDGKPQYLADAPRFLDYIRATASRYAELKPLLRLVERVEGVTHATGYAFGRV